MSDESEGITELSSKKYNNQIGKKYFKSNSPKAIDLSITPNRADCLGVRGVARDLAAAGAGKLKKYDQNKNLGKLPLRELLKKYNAISFVPDQKLGFNVDTKNLWESYGKSICTKYLLDSSIVSDGWINKKWIRI